jgi:hypothetical protein
MAAPECGTMAPCRRFVGAHQEHMADIKISVATPAFGEMFYAPYVQSLLRLQRAVNKRG